MGDARAVAALLAQGARVRPQWSAVHEAAAMGHLAVLRELLRRGHDPLAVDRRGRSVKQLAAENGHPKVLDFLEASEL